ncbi:dephospho-CoA kinase [Desulfovirgula thermocuniculi]|uniref:dephospho-CoA kinase n=1 Tax=Desulfovirgula thermocuniculi TaxID=348842 RepID=UPI0004066579|nr:dephospho-CoA kinase [Desulfovirgula thermocuniculi]
MIVGLTGGIATGKSTVARMFGELGAHVIDFDALARQAVEPGKPAWQEIVDCFGAGILNPDRTINRQKLGRLVFDDPEKLQKLNQIVHPRVFAMDRQVTEEIRQKDPRAIIVKEIPLLLEAGAARGVDKVVVVYASPEEQLKRLLSRGLTSEEALKRMRAQAPLDQKVRLADYVIYNEGSMEETRRQVEEVYAELLKLASSR